MSGHREILPPVSHRLLLPLLGHCWATGEPTLPPPANVTLGRPRLPTDYRFVQRWLDRGVHVLSGLVRILYYERVKPLSCIYMYFHDCMFQFLRWWESWNKGLPHIKNGLLKTF